MRTRITKKVKEELKNLIDNKGYWSDEVREFISEFNFTSSQKLHAVAQVYQKYNYDRIVLLFNIILQVLYYFIWLYKVKIEKIQLHNL